MKRAQKAPAQAPESKLVAIGHYHQPPRRHPVPRRVPEGMEWVELVTYGRGWVELEKDEWVEVVPGTLLWHVGGDQTIGRSDFKAPYQCLAVRFLSPAHSRRRRPAPHIGRWDDIRAVRDFTDEVVGWHAMEKLKPTTLLNYILARLHLQIELDQHRQTRQGMPGELQRIIRHIDQYCGQRISLREMAQVAQWSVPQLCKMFRTHLKRSPHQWLLECRVKMAREHLASTNHPIKHIAAECGFYSPAAFCAQFKRAAGTSPNAYRKQMTYEA